MNSLWLFVYARSIFSWPGLLASFSLSVIIFKLASCGSSVSADSYSLSQYSLPLVFDPLLLLKCSLKPPISLVFRDRDTLMDSTIFELCSLLYPRTCSTLTCDTQKFFHAASKLVLEYIAHCVQYVYSGTRVTDVPNI